MEAKVRDVARLYFNPPAKAVVALARREVPDSGIGSDRTDLPDAPGTAGEGAHRCLRHGTTTLFAALPVSTGKVTDAC